MSPQESYSGPIINRGAIVANGSELTINATTWVNDGTIAATGGTLNLYGNWTNNGTISAELRLHRQPRKCRRHQPDLNGCRRLCMDE